MLAIDADLHQVESALEWINWRVWGRGERRNLRSLFVVMPSLVRLLPGIHVILPVTVEIA
jgi:hypothetical protein